MRPLCIYHAQCSDGFAAAWVVGHSLGFDNVDFHAADYGTAPPPVARRDVVIVDFSYKHDTLIDMATVARSLLILDHHKSAAEDLARLPPAPANWHDWWTGQPSLLSTPYVGALFDMERSGAGITWDFFKPNNLRPALIEYVEDRDLWHKRLPGCDKYAIALQSMPFDFKVWSEIVARDPLRMIAEGEVIQRYQRKLVEEFKAKAYEAEITYHDSPGSNLIITQRLHVVNAPKVLASEIAGELAVRSIHAGTANDTPVDGLAAVFYETSPGRWEYSLRGDGAREVAEAFGGGGHPKAAGFTVAAPVHVRVP